MTATSTARTSRIGVLTLSFALLFAGLGAVAVVDATSPSTIEECQTIDEPGDYTLDGDLTTDDEVCLSIAASDVTVDGNGHSIERTTAASGDGNVVGVYVERDVSDPTQITVQNLTVTGWEYGLRFEGVTDSQIAAVTATNNTQHGIDIRRFSENVTVSESAAFDNDARGIYLLSFTDQSTVRDSVAKRNGFGHPSGAGIGVATSSDDNMLTNNTVTNNRNGVFIGFFSDDNVIKHSTLVENDVGVYFDDSDNEVIQSNIAANDRGLVNSGTGTVIATDNWWGHASGPGGDDGRTNPAGKVVGQGDEIDGDTVFKPWLRQSVEPIK